MKEEKWQYLEWHGNYQLNIGINHMSMFVNLKRNKVVKIEKYVIEIGFSLKLDDTSSKLKNPLFLRN